MAAQGSSLSTVYPGPSSQYQGSNMVVYQEAPPAYQSNQTTTVGFTQSVSIPKLQQSDVPSSTKINWGRCAFITTVVLAVLLMIGSGVATYLLHSRIGDSAFSCLAGAGVGFVMILIALVVARVKARINSVKNPLLQQSV